MTQALTINSVDISPKEIAPGEDAEIQISLINNLNKNVEDISIRLKLDDMALPFAPYGSSNEETIDKIKEDKSKTINFEIIALTNANSGIYKIPLEIIYYDEDSKRYEKESLISITINSKPIIGVGVEDSLLLKSQENEITLKVINKGLSDVKFLEVETASSTYYTILSSKNVYIGDIDSDDFDSVDFKLYFKEKSPSTINLPVKIFYKDAINNEYTEDFTLPLRVYTKKQAVELGLLKKSSTITYIGIIVGLVIIWIIYRKMKKRRKMKKAQTSA